MRAFVQPETLEGRDQYFCEKCNKKCDAHKVCTVIVDIYTTNCCVHNLSCCLRLVCIAVWRLG